MLIKCLTENTAKIKHSKGIWEVMILILKIHGILSGSKTEWDCHYIITAEKLS